MQPYKPRPRDAVYERLESYIVEHGLTPGDRLPAERELCAAWGASRSTLRSAVAMMEKDGLLRSRQGAGTYLAPPKFTKNLQDLHSLSASAAQQGRVLTTKLLELKRAECDKILAKKFGQMLGYPLHKLVRLRLVDGEPLLLETAFLPAELAPGLERRDLEAGSLFAVLEEEYGLHLQRGEEKIGITYATAGEAEILEVPEGAPLFWIVSQTRDAAGLLLEYCRTVARPDRLRLTSVLEYHVGGAREEGDGCGEV